MRGHFSGNKVATFGKLSQKWPPLKPKSGRFWEHFPEAATIGHLIACRNP